VRRYRERLTLRRRAVKDGIDYNRVALDLGPPLREVPGRIAPRDLELGDVLPVDLIEARVVGAAAVAVVDAPGAIIRVVELHAGRGGGRGAGADEEEQGEGGEGEGEAARAIQQVFRAEAGIRSTVIPAKAGTKSTVT